MRCARCHKFTIVHTWLCLVVMRHAALMEGYIFLILLHTGKISLSTRCKSVNKMVDFVVPTLVGVHKISTVIKHDNTNMESLCTENIMMYHS